MFSSSKSVKVIISETHGDIPTLAQLRGDTYAINLADGTVFKEDRSVSPAVVKQLSKSPRRYIAALTQADTDAPVATVILDQITGLWFKYVDVGVYYLKGRPGTFPEGRTRPNKNYDAGYDPYDNTTITGRWIDDETIEIVSQDAEGNAANDILDERIIEILVY